MSIYLEAQAIAASGKRVLAMVSRGRDSLCMIRVLLDHVPRDRLVFLHLRTYQTVEYINAHLARLEAFFGIKIEVQPSRQARKIAGGKLGAFAKERDDWRKHYGCDLVAYGFRSDESVSRAVIMREAPEGIHPKSAECYPLKRFNRSVVAKFAQTHRLPLAVEYEHGARDVSEQFVGELAVWLHDTFPDDFRRACAEDPWLEAEFVRASGMAV